MPCAPRCWARKTVARITECQGDSARELFSIALTPDKKQWSGVVLLDEKHLLDPLKWRKPALVAMGFHGDWGRLSEADMDRVAAVMVLTARDGLWPHRFIPLTKQPQNVVAWAARR